jgi:hypothetical protein
MMQLGKTGIFLDNQIMEKKDISGLDQFMHENQMWERALNFYKLENAFLKTRLSQVVDKNTDKDFVNIAEHFHNRLLFTDEYINELFLDLRMQTQLIKKSLPGNTVQENSISRMQDKLRRGMENFEKDIASLKNDFNVKLIYPYC